MRPFKNRLAAYALCVGLIPVWTASRAPAQLSSAQITGVVTDTTGAVIANAGVLIVSQDTGVSRTIQTNDSGEFIAPALAPGRYRITVEAPGFQTLVAQGLTLAVADKQNLSFSLKVGETKDTVTVTSEAAQINTTNAEISTVVNETGIKELPLNGRDPSSLVFLTTGVSNVLNTAAGAIQAGTSIPTETGASAGGGRQGSTYYLLDGVPKRRYLRASCRSVSQRGCYPGVSRHIQ